MKKLVLCVTMLVVLTSCSKFDIAHMKENLIEQTGYAAYALKEYPDDPYIRVVFFDIDYDGIPEAFVTYKGGYYNDGRLWEAYRFKNGRWQPMNDCVFALEREFFVLTEEGQNPKLIVIQTERKSVEFDDDGTVNWKEYISRLAYQIAIDKKGCFKTIPIPEFEVKDVYLGIYQDPDTYTFAGFPEIKLKSPNDKLDPVQVETFYPKGFVKEK